MNTATVHIPTVGEHTKLVKIGIGSGAATDFLVDALIPVRRDARIEATLECLKGLTLPEQLLLLELDKLGLLQYRPRPFRRLGAGRTTTADWQAYQAAAAGAENTLLVPNPVFQLLDINVVQVLLEGDSIGEIFLPDFFLATGTEEHFTEMIKYHLKSAFHAPRQQITWGIHLDGPLVIWASLYHSLTYDSLIGFETPSQLVGKSLQDLADIHFDHELAALGLSYRAACSDPNCPCDGENNSPEHQHGWQFYPAYEDWVHSFVYTYISSKS